MDKLKKEITMDEYLNLVKKGREYTFEIKIEQNVPTIEYVQLANIIVNTTQKSEGKVFMDKVYLDFVSKIMFVKKYTNIDIDEKDVYNSIDKLNYKRFDNNSGNITVWQQINAADFSGVYYTFSNFIADKANDLYKNTQLDLLLSINSSNAFLMGGADKLIEGFLSILQDIDMEQVNTIIAKMEKKG